MNPLRIAVIIDADSVLTHSNHALSLMAEMEGVELSLFSLKPDSECINKQKKYWSYGILRRIDKKLLGARHKSLRQESLSDKSSSFKYSYNILNSSSSFLVEGQIQGLDFDIIIDLCSLIPLNKKINVSRWGIFSLNYHHSAKNKAGPPAFWEVVQGLPLTSVTLEWHKIGFSKSKIIGSTQLRTDSTSFYRNQKKIFAAGNELLVDSIRRIAKVGPEIYFSAKFEGNMISDSISSVQFQVPGHIASLRIFLIWAFRNLSRKIEALFFFKQWQIRFEIQSEFGKTFNRFLTLNPLRDRIWADPFVLFNNDIYYIFFEEKLNNQAKAHISYVQINSSGDLGVTSEIALIESFHLSYPFVFEYNRDYYMIPESAESGELYLYKATSFPGGWIKIKTLFSGLKIYDSTIHFHDGLWYLFCTAKKYDSLSSDAYMHIFYSMDLFNEPLNSHPANPIYRDVRKSRPAGKLFYHEGRLIRPAQICAPGYGSGIVLNEIIELTPQLFRERQIDQLFPDWDNRIKAMHTLNRDRYMTVIDIQKRRFRWA